MSTNKVNNFESIYCTMCLLCVEMGCDDLVIELLRLGLDLQVNIYCTMCLLCVEMGCDRTT